MTSLMYSTATVGLGVVDVQAHVDAQAKQLPALQLDREVFKNAEDVLADAKTPGGTITVRPVELELNGKKVRKRAYIDDGAGMTAAQAIKYVGNLASSSKKLGSNDRHGSGLKLATARSSAYGLLIKTWRNGRGTTVVLGRDEVTGEIGLIIPEGGTANKPAVTATIDEKPDEIDQHGTMVVILGDSLEQDTTQPPPDAKVDANPSWLVKYLNARFVAIDESVTASVQDMRPANRRGKRAPARRPVTGQGPVLEQRSELSGTLKLSDATADYWVLAEPGETIGAEIRPHVGVRFQDELYERHDAREAVSMLQRFGLVSSHHRLAIHIRPDDEDRFAPSLARDVLKVDGEPTPWNRWADEFRRSMPDELRELEKSERRDVSEVANEAVRKHIETYAEFYEMPQAFKLNIKAILEETVGLPPLEVPGATRNPDPDNDNTSNTGGGKAGGTSSGDGSNEVVFADKDGDTRKVRRTSLEYLPRCEFISEINDPEVAGRIGKFVLTSQTLQINTDFADLKADIERVRNSADDEMHAERLEEAYLAAVQQQLQLTVLRAIATYANNQETWTSEKLMAALSPEALTLAYGFFPWSRDTARRNANRK